MPFSSVYILRHLRNSPPSYISNRSRSAGPQSRDGGVLATHTCRNAPHSDSLSPVFSSLSEYDRVVPGESAATHTPPPTGLIDLGRQARCIPPPIDWSAGVIVCFSSRPHGPCNASQGKDRRKLDPSWTGSHDITTCRGGGLVKGSLVGMVWSVGAAVVPCRRWSSEDPNGVCLKHVAPR